MKYFVGALSVIVVLILAVLIFIYSGVYNMSANDHHEGLTMWIVDNLKDNSIKYHADENVTLPDLNDPSLVRLGFSHYNQMCVSCHGAPGKDKLAKGFYPDPPLLTEEAGEWTPAQLFWIIKNGLKMTAMPAFGESLDDQNIWAIVAFTHKVPQLTKEQYEAFEKETKEPQ